MAAPPTITHDGARYVALAEYERVRAKQRVFKSALVDIAHRMNRMADEIEALQSQVWTEESAHAPLTESPHA